MRLQQTSLSAQFSRSHQPPVSHPKPVPQRNIAPAILKNNNYVTKKGTGVSSASAQSTVREQTLLNLLHLAIQNQQHYPASALALERQGAAIVSFVLWTDGHISDLQLVNSSGTVSLDKAALAAVNDAVPFQHVDHYLRAPQKFRIAIAFKLNSPGDT